MQGWANKLNEFILGHEVVIAQAVQIVKLAQSVNFMQGRRMDMVLAVCLYTACRKQSQCRVMLIDFADLIQVYANGTLPAVESC